MYHPRGTGAREGASSGDRWDDRAVVSGLLELSSTGHCKGDKVCQMYRSGQYCCCDGVRSDEFGGFLM